MPTSEIFHARSHFDHPMSEVFAWHVRPGALQRLLPPWSGVTVESPSGIAAESPSGIAAESPSRIAAESKAPSVRDEGAAVVLRMPVGPFGVRWVAVHHDFVEAADGCSFRDEQASGPFSYWNHVHRVEPAPGGSTLVDTIEYRLPLAPASTLLAADTVKNMLEQNFAWRHRRTREDLAAHARSALAPSQIAVTGANGLVGSQLVAFLATGGHDVHSVVRRTTGAANEIRWDPGARTIDAAALEGMDAVVHLAGENIAAGRWSPESKQRILTSRTEGTRLLCETLAGLKRPPRVLVSASAVGFYGDRGDAMLDEASPPGDGFLSDVCRQWEASTAAAEGAGIRVVHLRIGVVMTPAGGALAQMLRPFRLGAGGTIGSGKQFVSWISHDDLLAAILHCIATPSLGGPVNATSPEPVTNAELTRTLASVLRRPALVPVPAFAIRLLLGEMADALLLASARVMPRRLLETGFVYRHPQLAGALEDMLGQAHQETP